MLYKNVILYASKTKGCDLMKNQTAFSDVKYQNWKHISKKEEFVDAMNKIIPWDR